MTDWMVSNYVRPGTPDFDRLVAAVIQQESAGNPNAFNRSSGASGLMQVMPGTARDPGFGVRPMNWNNRFNAGESERFGRDYLGAMLNRYDGQVDRALAAYNWGPGNADDWSGNRNNLPAETQDYLTSIMGGRAYQRSTGGGVHAPQTGGPAPSAGGSNKVDAITGGSAGPAQTAGQFTDIYEARQSSMASMRARGQEAVNMMRYGPSQGRSEVQSATPRSASAQPIQGAQLARLFQ